MTEMMSLVNQNIERAGWHVMTVLQTSRRAPPTWAYSVGLWKTHRKPELYVSGLPPSFIARLINAIADRMVAGETFEDGTVDKEHLNFPVVFKNVPTIHYGEPVLAALRYYGAPTFPLLQVVWPDADGRFPWHEGWVNKPPQTLLYAGAPKRRRRSSRKVDAGKPRE